MVVLLIRMRTVALLAVLFLILLAGCGAVPFDSGTQTTPPSRNATVVEVIDGDTIDVQFTDGSEDRVRLLGIDTPEVHAENDPTEFEGVPDTEAGEQCLREAGSQATTVITERVAGQDIRLEFDSESDRRGGYDRLLAYVVQNDTNLNYWLVERGDARVYDADFTKAEQFYAAEADAQADQRGVWNCTTLGIAG